MVVKKIIPEAVGMPSGVGPDMGSGIVDPAAAFDKSNFNVWLHLHAVRVPKELSQQAAKILSKFVLDKPRIKHIVPDPSDPNVRRIILSEGIENLPEDKLLALEKITRIDVIQHDILLDYAYWPVEHILKDILPAGCEVPSAFECVGHIAHLNLRDELLPYRKIIAQVFLDKNQTTIKTVVNKVGTITNEFRVPEFEVLAGQQSLITEVKQHGAIFRMDYGLVYWNSRLEFEHKRLVNHFKPGQVVCDMFAGIGPFSIPAAQQGCIVYANDLNPASIKYLRVNAKLNKVDSRVHTYNMDARQFLRLLMRSSEGVATSRCSFEDNSAIEQPVGNDQFDDKHSRPAGPGPSSEAESILQLSESHIHRPSDTACGTLKGPENRPWEHFDHVVMNLPASALEFLDTFNGLFSTTHWSGCLPRIHCYCFRRSTQTVEDIIKRAEATLHGSLRNVNVWTVRDVAPNKVMLCLSFDLPEDVASKNSTDEKAPKLTKRPRKV